MIVSLFILGLAVGMAFIDLNKIWLYFGWANQLLATIMLWVGALYLKEHKKNDWIAILPAIFITTVCGTYLGYAPILLNLPIDSAMIFGVILTAVITGFYFYKRSK